jgi:hypothetical protein
MDGGYFLLSPAFQFISPPRFRRAGKIEWCYATVKALANRTRARSSSALNAEPRWLIAQGA